jgi:hypothetical protein
MSIFFFSSFFFVISLLLLLLLESFGEHVVQGALSAFFEFAELWSEVSLEVPVPFLWRQRNHRVPVFVITAPLL